MTTNGRWKTLPSAQWDVMSTEQLSALPVGTVREFVVSDNLRVSATHHSQDRWFIHTSAVSVERLGELLSAPREERAEWRSGWKPRGGGDA